MLLHRDMKRFLLVSVIALCCSLFASAVAPHGWLSPAGFAHADSDDDDGDRDDDDGDRDDDDGDRDDDDGDRDDDDGGDRDDDDGAEIDFILTVLHNNDGESQLIDAGSGQEDFGGVARFATLVDDLKRSATRRPRWDRRRRGPKRGVLMLSSGDNFLAGPEFNASLELPDGAPYYDTRAIDLIGYDALAIGNHEFDFGPDILAEFLAGFEDGEPPPFLSANLDFSLEPGLQAFVDSGRIARSTIVRERGRRIGIVGATTTDLPFVSSPRDTIINAVAPAVQAEIDALTDRGVEIIIFISHLQGVDEDAALLALLEGVDIAIAGGGDELLANEGDLLVPSDAVDEENNETGDPGADGIPDALFGPYPLVATGADGAQVPVVTTAGNYKYVGRLVVAFDDDGNVLGVGDKSGPVRVAGGDNPDAVDPDPVVQSLVVDPVLASIAGLAANVIGTSEVALDGRRSQVRSVETNEGNLIADALLWQANQLAADFGAPTADIALQNGGGIRNDDIRGPGDVTELDTFDILPFSNLVTIVPNISRDQFKEILENAVSAVEFGSGRFAQVGGFSFTYDPAGTPQIIDPATGQITQVGDRIVDVTLDGGTPVVTGGTVVPGAALNVATIDFLARGGDQYPYRGAPFTSVGVSYQQALLNYIVDALGGTITAADYPEGGEGRITELP